MVMMKGVKDHTEMFTKTAFTIPVVTSNTVATGSTVAAAATLDNARRVFFGKMKMRLALATPISYTVFHIFTNFNTFATTVECIKHVILQHYSARSSPPHGPVVLTLLLNVGFLPVVQFRHGVRRATTQTVFEERARTELESGFYKFRFTFPLCGPPRVRCVGGGLF